MEIKGLELAKACARAAEEIHAEDIRVLDLRGISSLTDFMVVCSGSSMPHLKAILREVSKGITEKTCLLYTSPSPRDRQKSRMPSSA